MRTLTINNALFSGITSMWKRGLPTPIHRGVGGESLFKQMSIPGSETVLIKSRVQGPLMARLVLIKTSNDPEEDFILVTSDVIMRLWLQ